MREVLAAILRYKARLQQENDPKIVLKTLRKLSDIEITAGLLKDTGIERTVYKIHKGSAEKGIANFAKQLLLKWKKTTNGKRTTNQIGSESTVRVKTEPDQYDPHKNWKMAESSAPEADPPHYKPSISVKQEKVEDYDPEQNWQVEDAPQNGMPEMYSFSPAVKREVSPSKSKKRRKENGIDKNHDSPKYEKQDFDANREAELIATIQKTQKELRKIREASKKSKVKVKQEPVSPPREEEDVEEYDPTNNYEVSSPPPDMYEPEPAEMDDPPQSPVAYQPGVDYDSEEPQMSDHDAENESPFEEDEPGAYLLHPRRTNSVNQSSHQQETVESDESTVGSSVHATTLFSFTKGSEGEDSYFTSKTKEKSKKIKNVKSVQEAEKTSTSSNSVPKKSSKSKKKDSKPIKIEKAVKIKVEKEPEASKKTQITKKSSKKRKIEENSKEEPRKKQPKPKIKIEKTVVKDAGFLFEDVPAVIPERKKKNKAKKKTIHDHSTVKSSPTPKITLHLPEVKATYRPLPQPSGGAKLKAHKESVLTDSQAAELHTQRQTKKMLVYSGHSGSQPS